MIEYLLMFLAGVVVGVAIGVFVMGLAVATSEEFGRSHR